MICGGIDAGSRSLKVVLFDTARRQVAGSGIADQGTDQARLAEELFQRVCTEATIAPGEVTSIVATGYGRHRIGFASSVVTEITCHARGVLHLFPETRTIIEIGGQDSKCIWLDDTGQVRDFAMNDRCAAGSGRFLEVVAERMEVELRGLAELSRASTRPATISSMCVVFAETEIVGLLAEGIAPADIAAGVQNSIASRVSALLGRTVVPPVVFTGGVALLPGMVEALGNSLGCAIKVTTMPQYTGALGAALLATVQPART